MSLKRTLSPLRWAHKGCPQPSAAAARLSFLSGSSQFRISASVGFPAACRIDELASEKTCDFFKKLAETRGVQKQLTSNYSRSWGKGIEYETGIRR